MPFDGGMEDPQEEVYTRCHGKICQIKKKHGEMRFKDLVSFNVVMLEKQGKKFQIDHNSLITLLFKARYFLNCDHNSLIVTLII